jgi:hypothetical protein
MRIKNTTEGALKSTLVKKLREAAPHFVVIRHEDTSRSGVPDISVSGNGKTTWWEVKYGKPSWKSMGIQELTLKRLAKVSYARYIVFTEDRIKITEIIPPNELVGTGYYIGFPSREGFAFDWVVEEIIKVHTS